MSNLHVPMTTVQRLPSYLQALISAQAQRMPVINSVEIAEMVGTNAAQVRKDLSYLGEYGTRGVGYDVDSLIAHLARWLGIEQHRNVAIVGFGRLGGALQGYGGFGDRGFRVVAVFDDDPDKIGEPYNGCTVESIDDIEIVLAREKVDIAMIAVPAMAAQSVADSLVAAGVKAILNFAPVRIEVPEGAIARQADLAAELQILSFHLSSLERQT
ncbi:MAG: redox-sensing transcriptional repressor Rex [Coriobacteriia bacterium]|nr:redox-sensing transcriptional repressor Rex [Coriobacteriia bacterium]